MTCEQSIGPELVMQVVRAANGRNEQCVRTVISRPMWRIFLRWVGWPEDTDPTPWLGTGKTRRVFGSDTIVVESEAFFSFSYAMPALESGFDVAP
jgi:hypothetical protein